MLVSRITHMPTRQGRCRPAAVMDLCSRRIKGWSLGNTMRIGLAAAALEQAVFGERLVPGFLFHADRGCQYASGQFRDLLGRHGAVPRA